MASSWRSSPTPPAAIAPSVLRTMNQRLLLDRLYRNGPTTRPRLARDSGLSQPTVFSTMADLETAGLARLSEQPGHGSNGRPALVYEADPSAGLTLAIDLEPRSATVALADLSGARLANLADRHDAERIEDIAELCVSLATRAIAQAGLGLDQVSATVIGMPAEIPSDDGRAADKGPVADKGSRRPTWVQADLVDQLSQRIPQPLTIESAVNLAALGVSVGGIARGVSPFVYVELGPTPQMALVIDGALYRGYSRSTGNIGSMRVAVSDGGSARLDQCLTPQAAAVYAEREGGPAVAARADVLAEAAGGAPWAVAAVRRQGDALAELLNTINDLLDPQLMVVAGPLAQTLGALDIDLSHCLNREGSQRPRIELAAADPDVVVQGAIAVGLDIAREQEFSTRLGMNDPRQLHGSAAQA